MAHINEFIGKATYDFSVDGGAVSAITPASNFTIPNNAIITDVYMHTSTAMTTGGGSATVALAIGGVTIHAAQAYDHADWDDEDVTLIEINDKTTSSGSLTFTVATAALTAGVVNFYVKYFIAIES